MSTFIIGSIVIGAFVFVIFNELKKRKNGESGCSGCSGCSNSSYCNSKK